MVKRKLKPVPDWLLAAMVCGYRPPDLWSWKTKPIDRLTVGEKVLRFAAEYLHFPEGKLVGQPLVLDEFQCAFVLAVFDSPHHVSKAILSMARRGGKTLLMAVICLAYVVGPVSRQNTLIRSAAMSREQAGLLHRMMALILSQSPRLEGLWRNVPSSKCIVGLRKNVEYRALSRDAKTGHGQGIYVLCVDECGQIDAPNDDFLDMLRTSLGSYPDSRELLISTQAPSDAAFFSVEIDAATRDQPEGVVCHLYTAPSDDIGDPENWLAANPSLRGGYRSRQDLERQADEAQRIPAKAGGFLNLVMNRRVALERIWLAPAVWKANAGPPDLHEFQSGNHRVSMGLDLSQKNDLTSCVLSTQDDNGVLHLLPFAFAPTTGMKERELRDKVPYTTWERTGDLIAVPGAVLDYEWLFGWLRAKMDDLGVRVDVVEFDRWRIAEAKAAADRAGFYVAEWHEVGQGFKDISPRIEFLEGLLLQGKVRHGSAPTLNLGASHAIVVSDPAGNRKLDKGKATQKIDVLMAALMAAGSFMVVESEFDVSAMIG